jgi:hypothetical protein
VHSAPANKHASARRTIVARRFLLNRELIFENMDCPFLRGFVSSEDIQPFCVNTFPSVKRAASVNPG